MKIKCDICSGEILMLEGGKNAVCKVCGVQYTVERLRKMLGVTENFSAPESSEEITAPAENKEEEVRLTESSEDDFVLKKKFGALELKAYNGHSQRVTFPSKWVEINDREMFSRHDEIVELVFPDAFPDTDYGEKGVFEGLKGLRSIVCNGSFHVGCGDFRNCKNLSVITVSGAATIHIQNEAFKNCTSLETVVLEQNAEVDITGSAFKNCSSLKTFTYPKKSVFFAGEGVESSTFEGCTSLESVVLPDDIKVIHKNAFKNCTSLKSVTTHSGDLSGVAIHPDAFSGSSFVPETVGVCPKCGRRLDCANNELTCSCGFAGVQYED